MFEGVWILHLKVSEFEFYSLKFEGVWILHIGISKFGFYHLNFKGVEILHSKVWEYFDFTSWCFKILGV